MKIRHANFVGRLAAAGLLCAAVTACNSHPDDDPVVDPDGGSETVIGRYGLDQSVVMSYFGSALAGDSSEYTTSAALELKDYEAAKAYVWQLWRNTVNRAGGEKLPRLTTHYELDDWGTVTQADMTWKVPEGAMKIFYAAKGSRPADGYPLFLYLHGSPSDVDSEWQTTTGWAQYFKDTPCAYFIPRSPQGGTGVRWFQPSKQAKWEQLLRLAFTCGDFDPSKIYFMGISEGAYGSQRLASFYADYLAGAGPIAGGEFLDRCPPENLAATAFCLQTGENDTNNGRNILTAYVGQYLDSLERLHPGSYVHKVDIQPGMGHGCDYTQTTPWLKTHTRNAAPKYVAWENYGMGGINGEPMRYRDTYYNLRILQPSVDRTDDNLRARYDMQIQGNNIAITVHTVTVTACNPQSTPTGTWNMNVSKTYAKATKGKLRIYLDSRLVDLSQPVTVTVNGRPAYSGTVTPDMRHMVESCRLYYDPLRVYPAAVDVDVQ